jgi:hypothetical protein
MGYARVERVLYATIEHAHPRSGPKRAYRHVITNQQETTEAYVYCSRPLARLYRFLSRTRAFLLSLLVSPGQFALYTRQIFLEHLKHCRVHTLEDAYIRSCMPVDNTDKQKPGEVYQLSLV